MSRSGGRIPPPRLRVETDSDAVFGAAVRAGVLSENPDDERFAGRYMYMHHDMNGTAWFKHKETRRYVAMAPPGADKTPTGVGAGAARRAIGPGAALWAVLAAAGAFFAGGLAAPDRGAARIGTVRLDDLAAEFLAESVRGADSPQASAAAAREWAADLETALDLVAERHGLTLLAAEAVAAGAGDYTDRVRDAMRREDAAPAGIGGDGDAATGPAGDAGGVREAGP